MSSYVVVQGLELAKDRRVISGLIRIPEVLEKFRQVEGLADAQDSACDSLMQLTAYANGLPVEERDLRLGVQLIELGLIERLQKSRNSIQGLVGSNMNKCFVDFLLGKITDKQMFEKLIKEELEQISESLVLVKKRIHWSEASRAQNLDEAIAKAKEGRRIDELIYLGPQLVNLKVEAEKIDSLSLDAKLKWFYDSLRESRSLLA